MDDIHTWMWYDDDVDQHQQGLVDDRSLQILQRDDRLKHELGDVPIHLINPSFS